MTLNENIAKFNKIVAAHKEVMTPEEVVKTARRIVVADILHRNDSDHNGYENLSLSSLADGDVPQFKNVCLASAHRGSKVSDVMQMRVMCDVLTLLLQGDKKLAMRYTGDVPSKFHAVQRAYEYMSYEECEKLLSEYENEICAYDEALKPVFKMTEAYLRELRTIQPRVNSSKSVITNDCMKDIWLPREYDNCGFVVTGREPNVIANLNGDKVPYVTAYNLAFVMDVLIRVITRVDKGIVAKNSFINRLQEIGKCCPECFPVGVDLGCNVRDEVYAPYHFLDNQALRIIYDQHFTKKKKLTATSVDDTLRAIKVWYNLV